MAKRTPNQRRVVLARLKQIKAMIVASANRFTVDGTVYYGVESTYVDERTGQERAYTKSETRKRRPEEYPENQAASWAYLFHQANAAAEEAAALRELARDNYLRCLAEAQS